LLEISGACKIPANHLICSSAYFSRFQDIHLGCCTVAAQILSRRGTESRREEL
jgi:hypothetical protein